MHISWILEFHWNTCRPTPERRKRHLPRLPNACLKPSTAATRWLRAAWELDIHRLRFPDSAVTVRRRTKYHLIRLLRTTHGSTPSEDYAYTRDRRRGGWPVAVAVRRRWMTDWLISGRRVLPAAAASCSELFGAWLILSDPRCSSYEGWIMRVHRCCLKALRVTRYFTCQILCSWD